MPFELQVNDTTKMNIPLWKTIADGVFIGRILSFKWKEFNFYRMVASTFKYSVSVQSVQTLAESEIRLINDSVLVRGKLCSYYQIFFPFLDNMPEVLQIATFRRYTDFLDNISSYGDLEIFYYDREEQLSDYNHYFDQLDEKCGEFKFFSENGEELAGRLHEELPDLIQEIITQNKARVREAFLIISVDCKTTNLEEINKAKDLLKTKVNKISTALSEINIDSLGVTGEHRDWFLTNFISHTVKN